MKNTRLPILHQLFCPGQWTIYRIQILVIALLLAGISIVLLLQRYKRLRLLRLNKKQLLCEQLSFSKQHFNTISRVLIQTRAELLKIENARIVKLSKEDDLRKKSFIRSGIYLKLIDLSNEEIGKKITKEDWFTLEQKLNNTYNNFSVRLRSCCDQISEAELHVCYLLKAGLSVTSITKIVGRIKSAVSMCQKRLFEKINVFKISKQILLVTNLAKV